MVRSASVAALVAVLVVGCVPYSVHDQTKRELEKAQMANADLVKKYNDLVNRLARFEKDAETRAAGPSLTAYEKLKSENENLKKQLSARFTEKDKSAVPNARLDAQGGIEFGTALLFSEGSADLRDEASASLDAVVRLINDEEYRGEKIIIEGHTDTKELNRTKPRWGTNMRLGWERAYAVFQYMANKGVPEERMWTISYSFSKPLDEATKDTEDGRAKNRRVVFRRTGVKI